MTLCTHLIVDIKTECDALVEGLVGVAGAVNVQRIITQESLLIEVDGRINDTIENGLRTHRLRLFYVVEAEFLVYIFQ